MAVLVPLSVGVALVISINGVVGGINEAETKTLSPLSSVGSGLLITRTVSSLAEGQLSSSDATALFDEEQAATAAELINLAALGAPGSHFSEDFFLPTSQLTFPEEVAQQVSGVPGVRAVAAELNLFDDHREGTVPQIIAEFKTQAMTIDIAPPTQAELAQAAQCEAANPQADQFSCLPARLRQVQIRRDAIRQVVAPPNTDIATTGFGIAGIDTSQPNLGMVNASQVISGRYLSSSVSADGEALVAATYAMRNRVGLGSRIEINKLSVTVVGIVSAPLGGFAADVYVSLRSLQVASARTGRVNSLVVLVNNGSDIGRVERALSRLLPYYLVSDTRAVADLVSGSLVTSAELGRSVALELSALSLLLSVAIASVIAASSMSRRSAELATLRAIGWSRRRVLNLVLGEIIVLTLIAAGLSLLLAAGVLALMSNFMPPLEATADPWAQTSVVGLDLGHQVVHRLVPIRLALDRSSAAAGILAMMGAASLTALASSRRISRLAPSEALRRLD
jgi:hypothetical protein